jgi:glycerol-3-phosphate O-acyltransferase
LSRWVIGVSVVGTVRKIVAPGFSYRSLCGAVNSPHCGIAGFTRGGAPATVGRMTQPVILPLWLFLLILLFAAVTFASHFLFPSVRWFFRRRLERAVARLNSRLVRPIAPFKLARRHDTIQRLIYDPGVTAAIVAEAQATGVPEAVAFEKARRYAREIVPAFSAFAYFTFGTRVARWLSQSLYRVRVGAFDRDGLNGIDPAAAVVFVMNHRSNMDYVLVTWLASQTSALSYAVGEWARVWPLSWLIRAMGAYFIRRRYRGALYRRVLARYVQMATAGGVTQAVFLEGGLSLDGRLAAPRLGILSYIVEDWRPGGREVAFVPVGLNYDRVIEDRFLVAAGQSGVRRFRPPLGLVLGTLGVHVWQRLTRRFRPLGTATVCFGAPLALSEFLARDEAAPTEALAAELMARIAAAVPVPPVPLLAALVSEAPGTQAELCARAAAVLARLPAAIRPEGEAPAVVAEALGLLRRRGLVALRDGRIAPAPGQEAILRYYGGSVAHHLCAPPAVLSAAPAPLSPPAADARPAPNATPAPRRAVDAASAKQ